MPADDWLTVIARIGLEPATLRDAAPGGDGPAPFVLRGSGNAALPPSRMLWRRMPDGPAALGIRVTAPVQDLPVVALKLAGAAIERGVMPVILSTLDQSGFEAYGFRVERLSLIDGQTDPAEMADLTAFWDFAVVIDVRDVAALA